MNQTKDRKSKKSVMPKLEPFESAALKLLEKNGWKVVVIGGTTVERLDFARQHAYRLVLNFTGAKIK